MRNVWLVKCRVAASRRAFAHWVWIKHDDPLHEALILLIRFNQFD